ncbi:unnamed protein product [Pseudo-nitzschia multistriata]|uniref:Uncharacterized protein n=1 Tax=Pseudo-nitzschia multistriata TaxID=183589 RepID=A0A448Z6W7_9STRA|nr:unnamed protein product [Pseudo-nitzschia multistriata]
MDRSRFPRSSSIISMSPPSGVRPQQYSHDDNKSDSNSNSDKEKDSERDYQHRHFRSAGRKRSRRDTTDHRSGCEDDEVQVVDAPPLPILPITACLSDTGDVEVLGSRGGQNALSDFPHAREDCVVHPFANDGRAQTNRTFCPNCYCYVCDLPASGCGEWSAHCQASRAVPNWKKLRDETRGRTGTPERQKQQRRREHRRSLPRWSERWCRPSAGAPAANRNEEPAEADPDCPAIPGRPLPSLLAENRARFLRERERQRGSARERNVLEQQVLLRRRLQQQREQHIRTHEQEQQQRHQHQQHGTPSSSSGRAPVRSEGPVPGSNNSSRPPPATAAAQRSNRSFSLGSLFTKQRRADQARREKERRELEWERHQEEKEREQKKAWKRLRRKLPG